MKRFELAIAGGGLTAARAIKSYREAGGGGEVVLFSEEATLPYHRPALSKRFLRGETTATPHVEDEAFYRDHDVEVMLGARVTSIHTTARSSVSPSRSSATSAASTSSRRTAPWRRANCSPATGMATDSSVPSPLARAKRPRLDSRNRSTPTNRSARSAATSRA